VPTKTTVMSPESVKPTTAAQVISSKGSAAASCRPVPEANVPQLRDSRNTMERDGER